MNSKISKKHTRKGGVSSTSEYTAENKSVGLGLHGSWIWSGLLEPVLKREVITMVFFTYST
jgi:hypothetical protein